MKHWRMGLVVAANVGLCTAYGCSAANSPSSTSGGNGGGGQGGAASCGICAESRFIPCDAQGKPGPEQDCAPEVCAPGVGCVACIPGTKTCDGNTVHECTNEGDIGPSVETCDVSAGMTCDQGQCRKECDVANGSPSNVGCEFWAVDLPNERGLNNAAANGWGVVLANAGQSVADVIIEKNDAPFGSPQQLSTVTTLSIGVEQLQTIQLPRAEVTGWTPATADPPGPPGTWLSSAAFRIRSSTPLVVYQFNVFTNSYANDASLLLPRNGLGSIYRVLGYPTANPIAPIPIAGVPDRTSVTVVGVVANTQVTITTSTTTVGDGLSIAPMAAGGKVTVTLGPFDVFNLSSSGIPGDMTGSIVEADQPIVVFTSGERAIVPSYLDPPKPPNFSDNCCTDHFEEQLFPVTSMGTQFVISRSPVRSNSGFAEVDELRFLGVAEASQVTTNLPAPYNSFSLAPGELVETWTDKDIVVEATQPIAIGQMLVSAGYTTTYIGDPSLTIFPPIEQYRSAYLFLVPPSWSQNHFVIAAPQGGTFEVDGAPLPGSCVNASAGQLGGVTYETKRCPIGEGAHRVTGSVPFGLTVYGYGNVGSYAFAGGADVKPIYEPPPIE